MVDGIILRYSLSVAACQRKQHNYDGGWSSYEVLVAFRIQTFFGGPYSPSAPSKLYSYLGDYIGDPLPPLPAGSEALKGRRANYFPTRSSAQIEFRNGGGGGDRGDVDDGDENEISLCRIRSITRERIDQSAN